MRARIGRLLRYLAQRIDPEPAKYTQKGMYYVDFIRGEVRLDGKVISKAVRDASGR